LNETLKLKINEYLKVNRIREKSLTGYSKSKILKLKLKATYNQG